MLLLAIWNGRQLNRLKFNSNNLLLLLLFLFLLLLLLGEKFNIYYMTDDIIYIYIFWHIIICVYVTALGRMCLWKRSQGLERNIFVALVPDHFIFFVWLFFDAEMIGTKKQTGKSALLIKEACLKWKKNKKWYFLGHIFVNTYIKSQ